MGSATEKVMTPVKLNTVSAYYLKTNKISHKIPPINSSTDPKRI